MAHFYTKQLADFFHHIYMDFHNNCTGIFRSPLQQVIFISKISDLPENLISDKSCKQQTSYETLSLMGLTHLGCVAYLVRLGLCRLRGLSHYMGFVPL